MQRTRLGRRLTVVGVTLAIALAATRDRDFIAGSGTAALTGSPPVLVAGAPVTSKST